MAEFLSMRIAYVVTSSLAVDFLRGQLAFLRQAGYEVTVISSPGGALSQIAKSDGVKTLPVAMARGISPLRDLISLWKLCRTMRRLRPAITNVSTPKAGLLAGLAAVLAGIPCRVYTLRGLRLETAAGAKRKVLWLAEWLACRGAHRVVCVSESLRERAVSLGLAKMEKTVIFGSGSSRGVDLQHFSPVAGNHERVRKLRQRLHIPDNALVVGFVGRLAQDKGVAELLDAFSMLQSRFPELRLLLVGEPEPGDPLPALVRQRIRSDLGVVCAGQVADASLYYHLMDVLALPTHREGFPNVVLEASASARSVVTTTATGAVDSVLDHVTGLLVEVGDANALAQALAELLSDPALRQAMGRAGREWVAKDFRSEAIWAAQAELYREMIDERSHAAHPRPAFAAKRAFDLLAATVALLTVAPVLLVVAGIVRLFQGSPVLFRQQRPGYKGRPFTCLKFRTMTDALGEDGQLLTDEERMTRLGRFLRSTSLDELPELLNVIRGDMSLVGPRPLLMRYLNRYTQEQARRHEAKPGITGWAQINGRNATSWDQKLALDVWYVDHRTFWLDLKILALTIWKTLTREGISQPGHATAEEFMGQKSCPGKS